MNVLRKGGSAADAFVATVLSEYVVASGYTSLSGPLNLLYFDASTQKTVYLDAGNNKVKDPTGQFDSKNPIAGKSFVVGGAGRGLEALFKRFGSGKLTFKELVTPAASWIADYSKKGVSLLPPMKNGQIYPQGFVDTGDAMVIRIDPKAGIRYGSPTEVLPNTIAVAE
jgi:gamma-glutamyltranspeptidase